MANLTKTAYLTRKSIKYGAVVIVIFFILRIIWNIGTNVYRQINPPPPPPATVSFNKLPALKFPKKENLPQFSYKLETIEGGVPSLDTIGKVYFMARPVANLLALDRAKQLASKMGFIGEPTKVSETVYHFVGQNPASTLDIDIISQRFKLAYDFISDQSIFVEKKLPNEAGAIQATKGFLSQTDLLYPDLENGPTKISYFKFAAPNLVPVASFSEADFVRVDLFRQDLDKKKILSSNPNQSLISFLFSGARDLNKRIVEVNYFHQTISIENFSTYPLKPTNTAWQELTNNQSFIALLGDNPDGKITVRKVYLAYFQSEENQNFLQPIFVFEGDKGFLAYVPAVDSKWVQ